MSTEQAKSSQPAIAEQAFTNADRELMDHAWSCFREPPQLDVDKLAEKLGKAPKTVINRWSELKKKLFAGFPPAAKTPIKATTHKKRKTAKNVDGEDDGASPAKKPRARKKKADEVPTVEADEENVMIDNGDI